MNRGNARATVFHSDGDYRDFLALLAKASEKVPMPVLGYCLMPNHFHLLLWPSKDGDLSLFMQWLTTAHVRRYHSFRGTSGHVWQGRFKAFPVQQDQHLLAVLRYIERNPLRARLVRRAENWRWSSLVSRLGDAERPALLCSMPQPLPANWLAHVNEPESPADVDRIRISVNRGAPFGDNRWCRSAAHRLGLEATLRPRGRPPEKGDIQLFFEK
jgi:putative transposase